MIDGYRELNPSEIQNINSIKKMSTEVGALVEAFTGFDGADQRWVSISKTDLQKGFMALVRAVAKPTTF